METSKLPNDEQADILNRVAQHYIAPCPYQPGDLLQPRAHHGPAMGEQRAPWVVLEVDPSPKLEDGSRNNLRLATVMDNGVFVTWSEHWGWERWRASSHGAGLQ